MENMTEAPDVIFIHDFTLSILLKKIMRRKNLLKL